MKAGAHSGDQVVIKRLAEEGFSAAEISQKLLIQRDTVESFMPKKAKTSKKLKEVFSDG